jgi:zinc finger MYND domain-containing protein 10
VWIAIYNVFMEPEIRNKYQFNEYRKSNLLRLKKFMNELLLDQIPTLTGMLRSLEELSIVNVAAADKYSSFVVQQMPEMRNAIMNNKNWKGKAFTRNRRAAVGHALQATVARGTEGGYAENGGALGTNLDRGHQ